MAWGGRTADREGDGRLELCRFVGFFRHFASYVQFAKEAAVVFAPARALVTSVPSLANVELKHAECRRAIALLHDLATLHRGWSPSERRKLVDCTDDLARSVRAAFTLEREIVFPYLRAALPSDVVANLGTQLAAYEELHTCRGERERHRAMGEALAMWSCRDHASAS